MPPRFSLLTTQGVCFPVSVFFLYITPQQHFCEKRWSKFTRLLLDSRVVIGQFLRNSLFLQAFYECTFRTSETAHPAHFWPCTCWLRLNTRGLPGDRHRGKKAPTSGPS